MLKVLSLSIFTLLCSLYSEFTFCMERRGGSLARYSQHFLEPCHFDERRPIAEIDLPLILKYLSDCEYEKIKEYINTNQNLEFYNIIYRILQEQINRAVGFSKTATDNERVFNLFKLLQHLKLSYDKLNSMHIELMNQLAATSLYLADLSSAEEYFKQIPASTLSYNFLAKYAICGNQLNSLIWLFSKGNKKSFNIKELFFYAQKSSPSIIYLLSTINLDIETAFSYYKNPKNCVSTNHKLVCILACMSGDSDTTFQLRNFINSFSFTIKEKFIIINRICDFDDVKLLKLFTYHITPSDLPYIAHTAAKKGAIKIATYITMKMYSSIDLF